MDTFRYYLLSALLISVIYIAKTHDDRHDKEIRLLQAQISGLVEVIDQTREVITYLHTDQTSSPECPSGDADDCEGTL